MNRTKNVIKNVILLKAKTVMKCAIGFCNILNKHYLENN